MSEPTKFRVPRPLGYNRGILNALYNTREIIPGAGLIALFITGMGASQYFLTNYYRDGWKVRCIVRVLVLC